MSRTGSFSTFNARGGASQFGNVGRGQFIATGTSYSAPTANVGALPADTVEFVLDLRQSRVVTIGQNGHKHPKVRAWLARHPRFIFHFTPKSCSWLDAVETLFSRLTRRRLKRGVFRSIVELQAAINRFLAETNADPKPFVWTAHPDRVIAAVQRGIQALESVH
jgi:transposase